MIKGPCKDCKDRFISCHSVCLKYIDYKQKVEAERLKVLKKKEEEYKEKVYIRQAINRFKRGKNGR